MTELSTPETQQVDMSVAAEIHSKDSNGQFPPDSPARTERPIALKKIPGTHYGIAITNLKHEIFVNLMDKTVSWDIPKDIIHLVGDLLHESVEQSELDEEQNEENDDVLNEEETRDELNEAEEKEVAQSKKVKVEHPEDKQEEVSQTLPDVSEEKKQAMAQDFKKLLQEHKISPFSSWEVESLKLTTDPRFQAIPTPRERRKVFDEYCAEYSDIVRKQAIGSRKDAQSEYQQLLEEVVKSLTRFDDFVRKHRKDERFLRVTNSRERQTLFTQYVNKLRIAEAKKKRGA